MTTGNAIIDVLIGRDGMSLSEARALLADAIEELNCGGAPDEILEEYFGLELDYFFDLLNAAR